MRSNYDLKLSMRCAARLDHNHQRGYPGYIKNKTTNFKYSQHNSNKSQQMRMNKTNRKSYKTSAVTPTHLFKALQCPAEILQISLNYAVTIPTCFLFYWLLGMMDANKQDFCFLGDVQLNMLPRCSFWVCFFGKDLATELPKL